MKRESGKKLHTMRNTKHILSLLLAAAFLLPGAYAADEAACATCHSCGAPTKEAPCLNPCPRNGSGIPAEEMPGVIQLDRLADRYGPVPFDHAGHAGMSGISSGCEICHHHSTDDPFVACDTCHEAKPATNAARRPGLRGAYHRMCFSCHREWSHESACVQCHAATSAGALCAVPADGTGEVHHAALKDSFQYPTPEADDTQVSFHHADHTDTFGVRCAACHEGQTCGDCHDSAGAAAAAREDPHDDCIACHQEWIEDDCTFCHQEAPRPRFSHAARTGFDTAGVHGALGCESCHPAPPVFAGLNKDCTACHEAGWVPENFDHSVTGHVLDETHVEAACEDCHQDGLGSKARCDMCHDDAEGPEPSEETE